MHYDLLDADSQEESFYFFDAPSSNAGVGQQDVAITSACADEALGFLHFISQIGQLKHVAGTVGKLALDDEAPREVFLARGLPATRESPVAPAIIAIENVLDRLAQNFAGNRQAKLLKAVPAKGV
jgi:hypothetical protein